QSESEEKEVAAEGDGEKKKSAEEETVEESKETKAGSEDAEKENVRESIEEKAEETVEAEGLIEEKVTDQSESEEKEVARDGGAEENSEIKIEENLAKEEEEAVVGIEPSLVFSEELADENSEGVTDEEWLSWKSEFVNKFNKRFDRKWIISGIGIVVLIVGLVIFLKVPGLRSTDSGEVKSLKEIAGPVYDMKFFLPLDAGASKTKFVKVTVAIELMDKGFKKEIDKKVSELRKEVIDLVLSKSPKEVKSAQGKEKLRKEITTRLNKCLIREGIKNTYFTEMVVL
ncbi:MAG: flagellar basal body-associated FliL family protein, partial [Deltaproteobacteria bacterium]|nr:flagellar basal body-associated FliL family protein [Deltaproteobacteria bacterium]